MKHWRKYAATASPVVATWQTLTTIQNPGAQTTTSLFMLKLLVGPFFLSLELNYTSLMFERLQEKARGPFHPATCGWWACQTNRVWDWMYTKDRNKENSSRNEFMLLRFRMGIQKWNSPWCVPMCISALLFLGLRLRRRADKGGKKGYVCPMSTDLKYSLCFVYIDRPSEQMWADLPF